MMASDVSVRVVMSSVALKGIILTTGPQAALRRCADAALAAQEAFVPVDTGNLKSALGTRPSGNGTSIDVGVIKHGVDYALPVEEGHRTKSGSWVPAQPFIRPSINAAKRGLRNG